MVWDTAGTSPWRCRIKTIRMTPPHCLAVAGANHSNPYDGKGREPQSRDDVMTSTSRVWLLLAVVPSVQDPRPASSTAWGDTRKFCQRAEYGVQHGSRGVDGERPVQGDDGCDGAALHHNPSCDGSSSPQRRQYCIGAREGRSSRLTVTFRPQFSHSIFFMAHSDGQPDATDVTREYDLLCGKSSHYLTG